MNIDAPKRIWITGASEGLSLALAIQLLEQGCEVTLSGRVLPNHAQLIEQYPHQLQLLTQNLSDSEQASSACRSVEQRWPAVDLLIINAGSGDYLSEQQINQSLFESLIESNIFASANCLNCAAHLLKEGRQPRVVAILSRYTAVQLYEPSQPQKPANSLPKLFDEARKTLQSLGIELTLVAPQTLKNPITSAHALPQVWTAEDAAQAILARLAQSPHNLVLETLEQQSLWPLRH
ncbi:short-chain dehydrogenase [Pseudomonas sp. SDI]|uniref:SDR family NAD(P)-dependent oxidoreductase n=1 Tax=Pseudomonas sp. SDI TaxID=2170734 RepID=UPI000DE60A1C|nr:SDR family NAD(P)-dependent oxidoreductase [Pseudomonas sp. SDI]PWB35374.1 short-chain dehydrogenase [Pseudomonas sp. SDI]